MVERITSRQNDTIRRIRALAAGDAGGGDTILLDGVHLVATALAQRHPLELVIVTSADDGERGDEVQHVIKAVDEAGIRRIEVPRHVMDAVSPVRSAAPIVALARAPRWSLDDLVKPAPPLVVVAVDVQDPGNVGAIIRAADAADATGVGVTGSSAAPFGWKALRGAMGSALRLPVVRVADPATLCTDLAARGLRLVAATADAPGSPYDEDLTGPLAILVGSEGRGLPDRVLALAAGRVAIPMREGVESLNVAVSAALIAYEARRQRSAAAAPRA